MAQITIREKDLTGAAASTTFNVAVVPGLVSKAGFVDFGKPLYFNTLSKFQKVIGGNPVKLTGDGIAYKIKDNGDIECPTTQTATGHFFASADGVVDFGYVYATELLTAGIPIYYLPIEGTTAQAVYDALEGKETTYQIRELESTGAPVITDGTGVSTLTVDFQSEDFTADDILEIVSITNSESTFGEYKVVGGFTVDEVSQGDETTRVKFKFGEGAICVPTNGSDPCYPSNLPIDGGTAEPSTNIVAIKIRGAETQAEVDSVLLQLVDRGTYNVKYITSGGYPTFEYDHNKIAKIMLQVAGAKGEDHETDDYYDDPAADPADTRNGRGDAVALIDHFEIDERKLSGVGSVFYRINTLTGEDTLPAAFLSFGAMFTPYANYTLQGSYAYINSENKRDYVTELHLPASFAYLTCLARQLKAVLPTFEATAGVGRGSVTNIKFNNTTNEYEMCTRDVLTNYIANMYNAPMGAGVDSTSGFDAQISINAITQVNPYGMVIYGTRTLAPKDPVLGVKATGILNIRNMVSDIKKQMYQVARKYMFSANNDALWLGFRSDVATVLDGLRAGAGIKNYTLDLDEAKSTKDALYVLCSIQPVYPVEHFDITIEITDEDIEINEA